MMDLRTADITVGELAKLNERIAALEAERDRLAGHLGDLQNVQKQLVGHYERLEAELQPWRQMARQLDALRGAGWWFEFKLKRGQSWCVYLLKDYENGCRKGEGNTLPAAVAAAYGKVVGDE